MKATLFSIASFFILTCVGQDLPKSNLWKVEKEGMEPSYIFGTIHVLPQTEFKLNDKVRTALYGSDELVMELDMSDPSLQTKMMQTAAMEGGQTLDALMSEEDYAMLDKKLKRVMGIPLANVNSFKPFMISTFLLKEYVGDQPASFELALLSMASNRQMPISGLETIESQMAVFDSIPYESQVEDLLEMVRDSVEMNDLFRDMIDSYIAEDLSTLYSTTKDYFDSEDEMKFLLYKRNNEWINVLNEKLGDKALFVAVGAAHLGGEQGIINLLKKEGYTLTPIMN